VLVLNNWRNRSEPGGTKKDVYRVQYINKLQPYVSITVTKTPKM